MHVHAPGNEIFLATSTLRVVLRQQHRKPRHDTASCVAMQGFWRIAVYNPMLVYQIGYNLTAVRIAHCLNNCNGHGQCDSSGMCQCESNWAGGDCSVNKDPDCQVSARHCITSGYTPTAEVSYRCTSWHNVCYRAPSATALSYIHAMVLWLLSTPAEVTFCDVSASSIKMRFVRRYVGKSLA